MAYRTWLDRKGKKTNKYIFVAHNKTFYIELLYLTYTVVLLDGKENYVQEIAGSSTSIENFGICSKISKGR